MLAGITLTKPNGKKYFILFFIFFSCWLVGGTLGGDEELKNEEGKGPRCLNCWAGGGELQFDVK